MSPANGIYRLFIKDDEVVITYRFRNASGNLQEEVIATDTSPFTIHDGVFQANAFNAAKQTEWTTLIDAMRLSSEALRGI